MKFQAVDKVSNISGKEFHECYVKPGKPVIFEDLAKDWPASDLWSFEYFRSRYGHWMIPMYDKSYHEPGAGYMKPATYKRFGEYLDIIEHEPTDLRFHNFQIMKEAPELAEHYHTPRIMNGFLKFALMFFGGKDSTLNLHYDIDCSHVFLTHFQTRKKLYLFSPDQSELLYHLPFTNHSHLDVLQPDMEEFPAYEKARGMVADIRHGETLFIPKLWWHFVHYVEGGFSLALRANDSVATKARGLWNLVRLFTVDTGMNYLAGESWKKYKENQAKRNASRLLV
ncbi:cupin-like domain-containing protein [Robertkochia aurantiaca]|uniref:cupin-like domain-containing protein n=1 Tax=Robertkochia aurantiaca TaxID=2873700 RepID=UPI001CCA3E13|nr:cupin-like domain-containing protein [Robertkochia sp. 3YJGBD-33]